MKKRKTKAIVSEHFRPLPLLLFIALLIYFLLVILFPAVRLITKETVLSLVDSLGGEKDHFNQALTENTIFIGSAVWTLSTVLGAVICFFYSQMREKQFGLSFQKLTAIAYGSRFIPLLLLFNLFVPLSMVLAYYIANNSLYFNLAILSIALQAIQMFLCLRLTNAKNIRKYAKLYYIREIPTDYNRMSFFSENKDVPYGIEAIYYSSEPYITKVGFSLSLIDELFRYGVERTKNDQELRNSHEIN